jgi:hypothetical protein
LGVTHVLPATLNVRDYARTMVSPRKRKNSRSENRASQRYTPPGGDNNGSQNTIPRPPNSCQPWHFYWCDGHDDWHHHDEFVVTAIERTMSMSAQDTIEE